MNFSLDHLRADNAYVHELPGDALAKDEEGLKPDPAPRQVQGAAFATCKAVSVMEYARAVNDPRCGVRLVSKHRARICLRVILK